jgi:tetratricopeptide (TPR) repeat protein
MARNLITAALLILSAFSAGGQDFNQEIYQAYISGNMSRWEGLIRRPLPTYSQLDPYDYAMACYGFIGYCMGMDDKSAARPYLNRLEKMTDSLLERHPDDPRILALRGALYGFRMNYQPQKIPFIGPKSLSYIQQAIEKGPECPQAWAEAGNKDWYMPALFGGSRERALQEYEKAIGLMEKNPGSIRGSWYYLNINMILAGWYAQQSRTFAANEIYRKLLAMEPDFNWARQELKD